VGIFLERIGNSLVENAETTWLKLLVAKRLADKSLEGFLTYTSDSSCTVERGTDFGRLG